MSKRLSLIDKQEILEMTGHLIDEYMKRHIHVLSSYHFDTNLYQFLNTILTEQLDPLCIDNIGTHIERVILKALNIYYSHIMPRRSHESTQDTKHLNISVITKTIKYLRKLPQPEQRTEAWHKFRYNLITASNAYKVYGSQSKRNEIICEKCKPLSLENMNCRYTESPFHWGTKYEPVSVQYYEWFYHTKVEDFGCIRHPKYDYIGASPDGINVEINSGIYGRMLEIKNPTTREITGIPKEDYWIQTQLQMEVCNLNHCDFLETKFKEYEGYDEFKADGTFQETESGKQKGIMIYLIKDDNIHYEYAPFHCSEKEFENWETTIMEVHENSTWVKNIYWYLDIVSCVLIERNPLWFNETRHSLESLWAIVLEERKNGEWIKRKPVSKSRDKSKLSSPILKPALPGTLIIDMSDLI